MKTLQNFMKQVTMILLLSLLTLISFSQNTKYGRGALASNTTGIANSAFGYYALHSNTTGLINTACGHRALYFNTTGSGNTATGVSALESNTTGYNNTANGDEALFSNTTGYNNIANGSGALSFNTTGYDNIAMGVSALGRNSTGSHNTSVGSFTLFYNTTGKGNTATGYTALLNNTTGQYNTATGYEVLYSNTTGKGNTATGYYSGGTAVTSKYCSFFGFNTDQNVTTGLTNSTALGNGSLITASNQVRIGNASVTSIGGYVNWSNVSDGRFKKNIKDNVKGLEFIMKLKPVSYNLDITGLNAFSKMNMKVAKGKQLPIDDDIQDIKAKEKIVYNGFVAQDVEKAARELNYDFSGIDAPKNANDVYGLRYADFVVPLVKSVQELSAENEDLKKELADLKAVVLQMKNGNIPDVSANTGGNEFSAARLEQNAPNPFNSNTTINYYLPQNINKAMLQIISMEGKIIRTFSLTTKGNGQVTITGGNLASGAYQYVLITDGKLIDSKKMVLTR